MQRWLVVGALLAGCSDEESSQRQARIAWPTPARDAGAAPRDASADARRLFLEPVVHARTQSAGIASVLVVGDVVCATAPDTDALLLTRSSERDAHRVVVFEPGSVPSRMAADLDGNLYVVLRGTGRIATVHLSTAAVSNLRTVCENPRGITYDKTARRVVVSCADGHVAAFDPAHPEQPALRRFVAEDLRDVVSNEGRLWTHTFRRPRVFELDDSLAVLQTITFPAIRDDNTTPRVATVAWRMIAARGGGVLLSLEAARATTLRSVGAADGGPVYYDTESGCGGLAVPVLAKVDADASVSMTRAITAAPLIVDIAQSDDGSVWFLSAGNAIAAARSTSPSYLPALGALRPNEFGTRATIERPCAQLVAPTLGQREELLAISVGHAGARSTQDEREARLSMTTVSFDSASVYVSSANERAEPRDTGYRLFHGNFGGSITCASCHPEGTDDGHTWQFPVGPRRTQSLASFSVNSAPFHWDGDLATMHALLAEVWQVRMRRDPLSDAQVDAISAWLTSNRVWRAEPALDAAAVERGRMLFEDADIGCGPCHATRRFHTGRSAVGTGGAYKVPSLARVRWRAPYMHDGCAATLRARFDDSLCGGGAAHGHTEHLSRAAIDDLISYMMSL